MRDALLRLRVPMTVLLLAVSGFQTLLRLVWIGIDAGEDGFVQAVAGNYDYLGSWTMALVITAAVGVCHLVAPPLPAARGLAIAAGVLVGLQVVLSALFALIILVLDDSSGAFAVFRLLFSFGELALMVGVLIVLSRFVLPTGGRHALASGPHHGSQVGHGPSAQFGGAGPHGPGSQVSASGSGTWQPDQNSGAVWGSAHQAASGVTATGWGGSPDQSGGWTPASLPPPQHSAPPAPSGWAPVADEGQQHTRIVDPRQLGQHGVDPVDRPGPQS